MEFFIESRTISHDSPSFSISSKSPEKRDGSHASTGDSERICNVMIEEAAIMDLTITKALNLLIYILAMNAS